MIRERSLLRERRGLQNGRGGGGGASQVLPLQKKKEGGGAGVRTRFSYAERGGGHIRF